MGCPLKKFSYFGRANTNRRHSGNLLTIYSIAWTDTQKLRCISVEFVSQYMEKVCNKFDKEFTFLYVPANDLQTLYYVTGILQLRSMIRLIGRAHCFICLFDGVSFDPVDVIFRQRNWSWICHSHHYFYWLRKNVNTEEKQNSKLFKTVGISWRYSKIRLRAEGYHTRTTRVASDKVASNKGVSWETPLVS